MSALLDKQTKVVVQISGDRLAESPSSGVTIFAEANGRIAQLLDEIIADPSTRKAVSLADHRAGRQLAGAQDFCSAMRLVEQECYQSA